MRPRWIVHNYGNRKEKGSHNYKRADTMWIDVELGQSNLTFHPWTIQAAFTVLGSILVIDDFLAWSEIPRRTRY